MTTKFKNFTLPFTALMTKDENLLEEILNYFNSYFGQPLISSETFPFTHTEYYTEEFGRPLLKKIIGFDKLFPEDSLVQIKHWTINLEKKLSSYSEGKFKRVINIDPGLMNADKVILPTTKDRSHRLFLGQGIYAEVTLRYAHGEWQCFDWTYPDYRDLKVLSFFRDFRKIFLKNIKNSEDLDRN